MRQLVAPPPSLLTPDPRAAPSWVADRSPPPSRCNATDGYRVSPPYRPPIVTSARRDRRTRSRGRPRLAPLNAPRRAPAGAQPDPAPTVASATRQVLPSVRCSRTTQGRSGIVSQPVVGCMLGTGRHVSKNGNNIAICTYALFA